MKRRVAIGLIGTTLDQSRKGNRWNKWRPTLALVQQEELFIDRLELIHGSRSKRLAHEITRDVEEVSPATQVNSHIMDVDDPWDFAEMYTAMLDFSRSYDFDPEREDYLINITTGTHVAQICWFLLTEANFIPGRLLQLSPFRAQKDPSGEPDYKGSHSIIDLDLSRYDSIATRFSAERTEATSFLKSGIATRNKPFNSMIEEIEKVAIRSRAPVLLTGPTGAGKSQLAKRVFELKKAQRQISGDFIEVNCATLRGDHAMSTLFGHVKGSFTGAQTDRAGLMKAADKGVLFLDEIGELGLDEQAMCLRAIEEKVFFPLGSDTGVVSDFQLLVGTNRDLTLSVRNGSFREDLFARLNMWTFQLPSLADRREDIEPNIDYELERYCAVEGQNITFNKEARNNFVKYALSSEATWSANFRDLSASIARMGTLAPQNRINEQTVAEEIERLKALWHNADINHSQTKFVEQILGFEEANALDLFDSIQLETVLQTCRKSKNISTAGRSLFAESRKGKAIANDADRLRKYLKKFDLTFDDIIGKSDEIRKLEH